MILEGRKWADAWSNEILHGPAWAIYCGWGYLPSWQSATKADRLRHKSTLHRIIYRALLRVRALYLLTH